MKEILKEYLKCINILRNNYIRFIKYQLTTKILISIILLPVFYWIVNFLMQSKGYGYLTNGLIKNFLFSYQGIFIILFAVAFGLVIILIEYGGLILISYQSISEKKETSYLNVLKYSISKIKYLIGIDGFLLTFYLLLMVPLLNQFFDISIFNSIKIPGFIMDDINSKLINQIYLGLVLIIFLILSIRWIFVMHIIVLENESIKHPLKKSGKLLKNNFKEFIKFLFFITIFNIVISLIIVLLVFFISFIILQLIPTEYMDMASAIVTSVISMFFTIIAFIYSPLNVILLTKFYLNINNNSININLTNKCKISIIDKIFKRKKLLILIFTIVIVAFSFISYEMIDNVKYNVKITAHRGSTFEAPENTISAIKKAIENGADFVEFDVRETKDHKVILLHDGTFKRTTGLDKAPYELTLKEIQKLDAGSFFSREYAGEKIPTLEEVIDYAKGKIKLNIEIKTDPNSVNLVKEVAKIIEDKKMINSCVVTSLDYDALLEIKEINPKIKTGYIIFVAIGDLSKLNVDFYSIEESYVTDTIVENAHKSGRGVYIWTINSEESMNNAIKLGVDNIITDNVKELKSILKLNKSLIKSSSGK
ncbi:glycerophosphodiester phosphodiesterase [Helicovermis profundi]|uniref:Glycerophosphodiester phosphodiesterase n=1 Tax=Helicovermis profundi TaxID=3065157 RepID=A0AAU9E303_9FIRM|nr:glycerophosphodiester phosphodiesterase [Clostridia bacterium S502]